MKQTKKDCGKAMFQSSGLISNDDDNDGLVEEGGGGDEHLL